MSQSTRRMTIELLYPALMTNLWGVGALVMVDTENVVDVVGDGGSEGTETEGD